MLKVTAGHQKRCLTKVMMHPVKLRTFMLVCQTGVTGGNTLRHIGMIAEEEDHAWTRSFHRGANYTAATPTLRTVLSLF